jgi:DNA adenine methylase
MAWFKKRCNVGFHKFGNKCVKVRRKERESGNSNTSLECKVDGTSKYCGKDKSLRPMIARAGGKTQLADKIISKMKNHKIYDEPFVGGGAVFLKKPKAEKSFINDKDKDVIAVFKTFKGGVGFQHCNMTPSKQKFDKIKNKKTKSPCDVAYLNKLSFGAGGTNYGGEKKYHHKSKTVGIKYQNAHINDYKDKLKNTNVTSQDFKETMKKADSKETVHFLDPPYFGADSMYKEKGVTPKEVCDFAKKMKGQVIITYNNVPEVRKNCSKGFEVSKISSRYTLGAESNNKQSKELLIIKP